MSALFFGTADFAVLSLEALAARHEVAAVITQPDRPKGRGRALAAPPVKTAAQRLGLPVLQPPKLRLRSVREQLTDYGAEVFVVAAFGQILSPRLLAVPPGGCVNVHASLLPRYRGAAPIQWAVINGEARSGVTIMRMNAGVDTGPILLQQGLDLRPDDTAARLGDRLATLGAGLLLEALDRLIAGTLEAAAQDESQASYAPMLRKEDGRVDFSQEARRVDCRIRGTDPWPGAYASWGELSLKLFGSSIEDTSGRAGEVLAVDDRGLLVACGSGAVWIRDLQLPGRRRMSAKALLAGHPLPAGTVLH